jgi:uncharacterized protein (DUF433 family)
MTLQIQIAADPVPLHWAEEGRVIRVIGTRISLDLIVHEYRNGKSAEQIAEEYVTLKLADVHKVIGYYLAHRAEVDAYVDEGDREADEMQRKIESDPEHQAWVRRVLARRADQEKRS